MSLSSLYDVPYGELGSGSSTAASSVEYQESNDTETQVDEEDTISNRTSRSMNESNVVARRGVGYPDDAAVIRVDPVDNGVIGGNGESTAAAAVAIDDNGPGYLADWGSNQSDLDISNSTYSYSADNEQTTPAFNKISRKRSPMRSTQEGMDFILEGRSEPNSPKNGEREDPSELKTFPLSPFASDRKWNAKTGMFPASYDSSRPGAFLSSFDSSEYGSFGSNNSEANTFRKMPLEQNEQSDNSGGNTFRKMLLEQNEQSDNSGGHTFRTMLLEQNDQSDHDLCFLASDSERTPVLSNHTHNPHKSPPPMQYIVSDSEETPILSNYTHRSPRNSPPSIQSIQGRNQTDNYAEELKTALLKSPTRKALISPGRKRPEPLHKVRDRQQSVSDSVEDLKGKRQPMLCRDILFAVFYIAQLIAIICLGLRFGSDAFGRVSAENGVQMTEKMEGIHFTYKNVIIIALTSGLISIAISVLVLGAMTVFTKRLVPIALCLSMFLSLTWTMVGLIRSPQNFVPVTGLFALGLSIAYTFTVWDRIPFVSANLFTALTAIRSTFAILGIALVTQGLAFIWIVIYFFTGIGVYDYFQENGSLDMKWRASIYMGLGLSFIWTIQTMTVSIIIMKQLPLGLSGTTYNLHCLTRAYTTLFTECDASLHRRLHQSLVVCSKLG